MIIIKVKKEYSIKVKKESSSFFFEKKGICTPILVFIAIFQAKMKQFIPLIGRTICQLGETLYYMNGR